MLPIPVMPSIIESLSVSIPLHYSQPTLSINSQKYHIIFMVSLIENSVSEGAKIMKPIQAFQKLRERLSSVCSVAFHLFSGSSLYPHWSQLLQNGNSPLVCAAPKKFHNVQNIGWKYISSFCPWFQPAVFQVDNGTVLGFPCSVY